MTTSKRSNSKLFPSKQRLLGLLALVGVLAIATPALAHHPLGGRAPSNLVEGFLSGVAHPLIGMDHFAFVLTAGLIAATRRRGSLIPLGFVMASLVGTGIHLMAWDLPAPELVIAASVVAFGVILAVGRRLNLMSVVSLGTLAGVFHGYAYGEAIVGAGMSSTLAYLLGFTVVQLAIALLFFTLGRKVVQRSSVGFSPISLRLAGFVVAGLGMTFLSSSAFG